MPFFPEGFWLGWLVVGGLVIYDLPFWVIKFRNHMTKRQMRREIRAIIRMQDTNQNVQR